MTPSEHRVLTAVKTCLNAHQRPSLGRVVRMTGLRERFVARAFVHLLAVGYLVPHEVWLRLLTSDGLVAVDRGPDEQTRRGRPRKAKP